MDSEQEQSGPRKKARSRGYVHINNAMAFALNPHSLRRHPCTAAVGNIT